MIDISPVIEKLRAGTRFIFFVTEEEDQFLEQLRLHIETHGTKAPVCKVFNQGFGFINLNDLTDVWRGVLPKADAVVDVNKALVSIHTDTGAPNKLSVYVIMDPELVMGSDSKMATRRLVNLAHQLNQNPTILKAVLFVGPQTIVHPKMQRYIDVVRDKPLARESIYNILKGNQPKSNPYPDEELDAIAPLFVGLTSFEVKTIFNRSLRKFKVSGPETVVPETLSSTIDAYKRDQLQKTELISYVNIEGYTFDKVGGAHLFRDWAEKMAPSWTKEGQAFGLKPPRGLLLTGIWGCGKSLSVKALANLWGLPAIALDMGKLRSGTVGVSEDNLHRVLRMIETVAPCIIFVDEAEKTFAGLESSGKSDSGVTARMIATLSTWVQETKVPVCMVMTANTLDTLPVEFIRRSNERFFFDMPTEEDRVDILKIHLQARNQSTDNLNLARLAEDSKFMVGSEIEHAIESSLVEAYHRKQSGVTEEILSTELKRKPRIFKTLAPNLKALLDWVGYDPDTNEGVRARFASDKRSEGFEEVAGRR